MIAATLVPNSSSAPSDCSGAPDSRVSPTTASGGTNEIAMATPGRVSEMSERTIANAPTPPVASAATRSTSRGLTRAAICPFVSATSWTWPRAPTR